MKPFKPEHYYPTAMERINQAQILYRQGKSPSLAMYTAGVAVECMLRAFKLKKNPTFDEKHDLERLFKASGILEVDLERLEHHGISADQPRSYLRELQADVTEICILWSNDYRFASEERLRAHLKKKAELRMGINGDVLKANALRLMIAAQKFIDRGDRL